MIAYALEHINISKSTSLPALISAPFHLLIPPPLHTYANCTNSYSNTRTECRRRIVELAIIKEDVLCNIHLFYPSFFCVFLALHYIYYYYIHKYFNYNIRFFFYLSLSFGLRIELQLHTKSVCEPRRSRSHRRRNSHSSKNIFLTLSHSQNAEPDLT